MSPRSSKKKSPKREPGTADVYVGLLFVGVSALLVGIIFLVMELGKYGWQAAG